MASLFITECLALSADRRTGGSAPMVSLPPLAQQARTIASTVAVSAAMGVDTGIVRFYAEAACRVAVVPTAEAVAAAAAAAVGLPMGAGSCEYFGVKPGQFVAVIGGLS